MPLSPGFSLQTPCDCKSFTPNPLPHTLPTSFLPLTPWSALTSSAESGRIRKGFGGRQERQRVCGRVRTKNIRLRIEFRISAVLWYAWLRCKLSYSLASAGGVKVLLPVPCARPGELKLCYDMLKIFDPEVMINGEGFTQRSGTAYVETQSMY